MALILTFGNLGVEREFELLQELASAFLSLDMIRSEDNRTRMGSGR